jgi:hypothetical protein
MMRSTLGWMLVVGGIAGCGWAGGEDEEPQGVQAGGLTAAIKLAPTDDTFVSARSPRSVNGSSSALVSDRWPNRIAFLKFKVAGLNGKTIKSAKLSLAVTGATVDGPSLYMTSTNWSEATVNYETRPQPTGARITDLGPLEAGRTVSMDVSSVIKGEGTYSFGLYAGSSDSAAFGSKEGAGSAPELELVITDLVTAPPPPTEPPPPSEPPPTEPPPDATPPAPTSANNFYVAMTGSDSNAGTMAAPFRTIKKGVSAAKPDTTIHVMPGTYAESIKSTVSGTATGRIRFVSETRWAAKLVPPASNTTDGAWDNRGAYVDIEGFEVDGTKHQGGTPWRMGIYSAGSSSTIKRNKVHDIAHDKAVYTCTNGGGAGVEGDSYYKGTNIDVIGNVVYDIGYLGCTFVQGIYQTAPGKVMNNVITRGGAACIHLWHDANHIDIVNNTVVECPFGILVGGGDYVNTSGPADYVNVLNNIVVNSKMAIDEQGGTGKNNVYANNLLFGNTTNWGLQNGLAGTNTVTENPLFMNLAGADYHLQAGSPAINAGTTTRAPSYDFDGKPRTQPDLGAFEK